MSETIELTEEDAAEPAAACTDEPVLSEVEGAFAVSGFKAAVAKPRFGQAHQQYFTPRWLCEALLPIAESLESTQFEELYRTPHGLDLSNVGAVARIA